MLVALAVCIPKLGQGDFSVDTGWYAALALQAYRGMADAGLAAWWTLQGAAAGDATAAADGRAMVYFNKPPLAFWLNGLPLAVSGPSIWAARLGSVIAAVACVGATTLLAARASGPRVGRGAGLVLALSIPFIGLARSFSLDLWLTLFMLLAMASLLVPGAADRRGGPSARHHRASCAVAGLWLGAALLVKPLIALLALPIIGAWMLLTGRARRVTGLVLAAIIAIAVAAVWHIPMAVRFGEAFTGQYFGREMADRAAGDRSAAVFNVGADSALYYARVLGETYWPWLITVILALAALGRRGCWRPRADGRMNDRDVLVFALLWTVVWLVALSVFADKRPRYLAPLFPVWAWASALWLSRGGWGAPDGVRRAWRAVAAWLPPIAVGAAVAITLLPLRLHRAEDPQWTAILAWMREHPDAAVYEGGLSGQRAAKVYLDRGRWPLPTSDPGGRRIADPPVGACVLYHARDRLRPGPGEDVLVQAGSLTLTRLVSPPWRPESNADRGENTDAATR